MYVTPDKSLLPHAGYKTLVDLKFNFTEWWKLAEGKKLSKLLDVRGELVAGLLCILEIVSALFYI